MRSRAKLCAGQYSISINWHICFRFVDGDAYHVQISDYAHSPISRRARASKWASLSTLGSYLAGSPAPQSAPGGCQWSNRDENQDPINSNP